MSEYRGVRYTARPFPTVNRVRIFRAGVPGIQVHRGFYGVARVAGGERFGIRCGHFHQKAKAARECAERLARALIREAETPHTPPA